MSEQFIIGVTGHRDMVETSSLEHDIMDYFCRKIEEHKGKEILLLSPLADGADRFVAKIFLKLAERYDYLQLQIPMPFPKERYCEDFNEASQKEFQELLNYAHNYFVVKNPKPHSAYVSLGTYVADESDELIALWDGTFNGKEGGTGEVVAYASTKGYALVHFLCLREFRI